MLDPKRRNAPTSLRIEQLRRGATDASVSDVCRLLEADIAEGVLKDCTKVIIIAVDDHDDSDAYMHMYTTEQSDYVTSMGLLHAASMQLFNAWISQSHG